MVHAPFCSESSLLQFFAASLFGKRGFVGVFMMPSSNLRSQSIIALATLSLLALTVSCRGFFVTPQLSSIAVDPTTLSLTLDETEHLTATGHYDDDSTKDLSGRANWTSSDETVATVNSSGTVTAASSLASPPGTATITASSGGFSATCTVTVNTGPLTAIAISVSPTDNPTAGTALTFTASGTFTGSSQPQDITTQVTWNSDNTTDLPINSSGQGTISSTAASGDVVHVTASLNGITSNQLTITVQ